MKLHHIAIATRNPQKIIDRFYRIDNNIKCTKGIAEEYYAECTFIHGDNFMIELVTPTKKDTPIDKFINKNGDVLHHIAIYGNGKARGALPNMFVDFKFEDKILLEFVEFKDENNKN